MIHEFLAVLASFIVNTISALGYPGVLILMTLESACIPIPSEIIMPFSGYLVFLGRFSFWLVVFLGSNREFNRFYSCLSGWILRRPAFD